MKRNLLSAYLGLAALSGSFAACENADDATALEADATFATKKYVSSELEALLAASKEMQAAAPAPDADGWNSKDDAAAVTKMRAAWNKSRDTYEHIEGSIAILFGELDISTDERYDGFIEAEGDDNLFDGQG